LGGGAAAAAALPTGSRKFPWACRLVIDGS
jgi:hypothetical protein